MNPLNWSFRLQFGLGAAICAALIGYALYVQHGMLMEPCPLCIFQRMVVMAIGAVLLLGALHAPGKTGRRVYGVIGALVAVVGIGIAGRHVQLQNMPPDQVPACGPGLNYLLDAFPLSEALSQVLKGSGECAKVDWTFLGYSMPVWTLVWFVILLVWALWAGFRRRV